MSETTRRCLYWANAIVMSVAAALLLALKGPWDGLPWGLLAMHSWLDLAVLLQKTDRQRQPGGLSKNG